MIVATIASAASCSLGAAPIDESTWCLATPVTRFTSSELSSGPGFIAGTARQAPVGGGDDRSGAAASGSTSITWGRASADGAGSSGADGAGAAGSSPVDGAPGPAADALAVPFGARGTLQFNIFGDYANDLDEDSMAGVQVGMSWFFVDHLSLDLQLEQYGIFQDGGDAYAIGPAMLFRWHFLALERWSLYADLGCGFIVSTESVPIEGSQFNFTPRAGVGASFEVAPRARVMAGVRWFHVSNANTSTPNPGRNSLELYAGLSLPF